VRRAAITCLVMLVGVLGADLIRIARVLSPSAMIGCALLIGEPPVGRSCDRCTLCGVLLDKRIIIRVGMNPGFFGY
jgi:hypothetical protein